MESKRVVPAVMTDVKDQWHITLKCEDTKKKNEFFACEVLLMSVYVT